MTPQRHPKQTASAISASHCFTLTQFDCCLHNPRFQFDIATLALISVPNDSQQVHLRLYATTHYLPNLSPPDRHQSYLQAVQASQAWPRRTLCPPLRPLRSVICRCGAITVYRDWIAAGCVVQRPVSILRVDNQNGCPIIILQSSRSISASYRLSAKRRHERECVQGCKGKIGIWQTAQRLLVIPSILTLTCGDMRARRPRAIVNATTLLSGSLLGDAYCTGKSQNSIVSRWVLHSPFPSAFLADRGPFLLHGCRSRRSSIFIKI
jgi:hypothetical protein